MLIDFHTHCFPDKLAERTIKQLSYVSGGIKYYNNATVDGLKKSMAEADVNTSVVLNIATNEHQMKSVNDFAASINNGRDIVAFGSVFPYAADAVEELERIKSMGLKGVKFHPEYQGFYVDDEIMKPIYKKISQLGLITVFHAGHDNGFLPPFHCMPQNLLNALKWIDTPVVAAHWGGLGCSEEVTKRLCGTDIYFDTSFGYSQISRAAAVQIIEKHGIEKILFGTDSPWHTVSLEMLLLNTLELSESEMEAVCYKNAQHLLNA